MLNTVSTFSIIEKKQETSGKTENLSHNLSFSLVIADILITLQWTELLIYFN